MSLLHTLSHTSMSRRRGRGDVCELVVATVPSSITVSREGDVSQSLLVSNDHNVVAFTPAVLQQLQLAEEDATVYSRAFSSSRFSAVIPDEKLNSEDRKVMDDAVISYDHAIKILQWEYSIPEEGVEAPVLDDWENGYQPVLRPENVKYKPVNRLRNVKKKEDLSLRAPGQGQSKLIVCETRFLETHYNILNPKRSVKSPSFRWRRQVPPPEEGKRPITLPQRKYTSVVMYVGAADGHHIAQFTQTYYHTLFILVDPRAPTFSLRPATTNFHNIHSIREAWHGAEEVDRFFDSDDGLGKLIARSKVPVLFISDIRGENVRRMSHEKGDESVENDQKKQDDILAALIARVLVRAYMLKFRPPYLYDKTASHHSEDESLIKERTAGKLWLQSFTPHSSSEMRIVGTCVPGGKPVGRVSYNVMRLDNIMAYINSRERIVQDYDALQVQCVVALMRENRKNIWSNSVDEKTHKILVDDHEAVFRFKQAVMNYNIPLRAARLTKWCTPMVVGPDLDDDEDYNI